MRIVKALMKYLLAVFFVFAGANHFRDSEFYLTMMPSYLPWHVPLVYLSGIFEMLWAYWFTRRDKTEPSS